MTADKIPSILFQPHGNSLSIERVLKLAIELIEQAELPERLNDRVTICLEDLQVILENLDRG